MISEADRYRATTNRIIGFAFLSPLGKIFIDPINFFFEHSLIYFLSYFTYSLLIGWLGIVFILKGDDILFNKED